VVEGRKRVERLACRRCHVIGASGNRLATNLDRIVWKRDQGDLARSIGQPVENMPRFGLDPRGTEEVIAFLLKSADPNVSEATYRVRFSSVGSTRDSAFETRCGGCHRALGANGPLGRGSAGPNLSGLFTPFYPGTAPGHRAWTREALGRWLENPRAMRTVARMRPVRLEASEQERIVDDIGGAAGCLERPGARLGREEPASAATAPDLAERSRRGGPRPSTARGGSKGGW
jgi:cytochrome c2